MLEHTLRSDFVPGSNLRGEVSGANWLFALPDLRPGTLVCLGTPSFPAAQALARRAGRLIVCVPANSAGLGPPATNTLVCDLRGSLPLAAGSVDLVMIAGREMARRVTRSAAWHEELRRVLSARGLVYLEAWGVPAPLAGLHEAGRLWLTPLRGEVHTAVPLDDRLTRQFFVHRRLFTPVLTVRRIKQAIGRRGHGGSSTGTGEEEDGARASRGMKQRLSRLVGRVERTLSGLEGQWHGRAGNRGRVGVLFSAADRVYLTDPPTYLRRLAAGAGLSLDGYRWGLWAGGQYSSRKVLFYLFEGAQTAPRYLVKLVRDPAFNPRLENEDRALRQLQGWGFGERHLLPRVAFSGCADDLFVVGETVVEGAPFLSKTALTPACPVAQAAVTWLTDLAAQTVSRQSSAAVAGALTQLFERFQALYRLPDAERDFLAGQIARLGEAAGEFPLVFQHGDPGPWNMLVAPDGRVALLDWESAELQGMPLWDLFYFLRSYALNVSRAAGESDRLAGVACHFLAESSLSEWIVGAVRGYCAQVGVANQYVETLYYTCWMHRALKQATLLPLAHLSQGRYVRLLRHSIARHDAPTLRALFAAGI